MDAANDNGQVLSGGCTPKDNKKALEHLKELALANLRSKHPNVPEHALPKPKYSDRTANGLTKCVIDYINLIGGIAERRNSMGRYLQPKTYTNVFGKEVQLGKGRYIPTTGRNGTADISGVFKGVPLAIEVKIGKDRQSEAQRAYETDFKRAGGWYCIAKSFGQFYDEFQERFGNDG